MSMTVLKSIYAENYAVFAERVEFTCVADSSKKEHSMNTFVVGDQEINRVSYLYGANGVGKTFFCKIIREIQNLIRFSPLPMINDKKLQLMLKNGDITNQIDCFRFDVQYEDEPTKFGIEVIIDDITYNYEFAVLHGKVTSELLTKKYRRREKLLVRTSPANKDILLRSEMRTFEEMKQVVREEALCLAMAATLNNEVASKVVQAILDIYVFNMATPQLDPARLELFSKEKMKIYARILQKADPTISAMKIELSEEEVNRTKNDLDDFENRELIQKKVRVGVKTKHTMYDHGVRIKTESEALEFFNDESLGTVKLFTTLPYLFEVLENGGTLVLDEIENGLHLHLVKELIALFTNDESNPYGGQLICTTHQPLLVDNHVKRDQVWIVIKDDVGKSQIQRLSKDSSSRANTNLTTKILEGAFGYVPKRFFE